jgi:hypothetical protein
VAIVTARWRFPPTAADVFDDQLDIVDYRCSRHKLPPLLDQMSFAKRSGATCCGKKSKPAGGTPAAGTCSQHGSSLREFSSKRATRKQAGKNEVAQK